VTITDVRTHRVTAPMHSVFATALRSTSTVDSVLVEVVDSDGVSGWGEGVQTWRITGDSLASVEAAVRGPLRDVVLGRDVDDLHALSLDIAEAIVANTAAKAAVDVAVYDLAARRLGVSLARFLGTTTTRVDTDVTISVASTAEMAEAARDRVKDGFDVLKVKVGDGAGDDVERMRAVRDAAGESVRLRVDANQGWSAREAVRIVRELEDAGLDIELVEQPVRAEDLDGLAYVTERVDTPVLADESVRNARDALTIVHRHAADLLNLKLAKCGGLGPALQLLAVAEASGTGVLVGQMMETPVGTGAAAALAAVSGSPYAADLDAVWWLSSSPVSGGLVYDGASIVLPDAPGLGIEGLA
jgi:L-Ala-D/L-Glu epimerase